MEIKDHKDLKAAISQLEQDAMVKKKLLIDQFHVTYENLQPINLIKNQLNKLTGNADIKNNTVGAVIGLGAGLLSKKIYERGSGNIFKQLVGAALEFGIAKFVANNSEKIKEVMASFLDKLFKSKEKTDFSD